MLMSFHAKQSKVLEAYELPLNQLIVCENHDYQIFFILTIIIIMIIAKKNIQI